MLVDEPNPDEEGAAVDEPNPCAGADEPNPEVGAAAAAGANPAVAAFEEEEVAATVDDEPNTIGADGAGAEEVPPIELSFEPPNPIPLPNPDDC